MDSHSQIHIVDDDSAIRASLTMLFKSVGLEVITHEDGNAFLEHCEGNDMSQVGCIVLDIRMPGLSGIEVQQQLKQKGIDSPLIFITGHGDIQMAVQAMHDGAFDFIQKPFRDQDLLDRVNAATSKADSEAEDASELVDYKARFETLTAREREVMGMIVEGKANKVVAADLNLSQRTVEIHRSRVMEKMEVRSLAELVRIAVSIERAS